MDIASRLDALFLKKKLYEPPAPTEAPPRRDAGPWPERAERFLAAFHGARIEERGGADCRVIRMRTDIAVGDEAGAYSLPMRWHGDLGVLGAELPPDLGLGEVAYLDTETTGLSRGSGTIAFLIGIGWFESPERFAVELLFAEDFCHERALLEAALERLRPFRALATYNGAGFDLPLLRTRAVMNRMRPSDWRWPHLDLLPWARRLWKGAFENCRLGTIERRVLGIARTRDVADSAEIPALWQAFARDGDPARLGDVFAHNIQDIATLGALAHHAAGLRARCEEPGVLAWRTEFWGLARLFEREGDCARGAALMAMAARAEWADGEATAAEADAFAMEEARLWRRAGMLQRAAVLWRGMLARPLASAWPAWIELAKHLEHRERAWDEALRLVEGALRQLELEEDLASLTGRAAGASCPVAVRDDLRKRAARLRRKHASSGAGSGENVAGAGLSP